MSDTLADPLASLTGKQRRQVERYEGFSEAENLLSGRGGRRAGNRARELFENLTAQGIDVGALGLDINDFTGQFSEADASTAMAYGRKALDPFWRAQGVNLDRARHNFRTVQGQKAGAKLAENQVRQNTEDAEKNVYPMMDRAAGILEQLAQQDAISAEEEAALRTNISNQIKTAESSRLRRVAATLGLRGMDPSSPAGAAMAARTAEEADQMLVEELRGLGLNVASMNKDAMRRNAADLANLAISRANLDKAIKSPDQALMRQVQSDVTALIDALYTRDKTWDFMMKQYEDANDESLTDRLGSWSQGVNSVVNMGSSLAQIPGMFKTGGGFGSGPQIGDSFTLPSSLGG